MIKKLKINVVVTSLVTTSIILLSTGCKDSNEINNNVESFSTIYKQTDSLNPETTNEPVVKKDTSTEKNNNKKIEETKAIYTTSIPKNTEKHKKEPGNTTIVTTKTPKEKDTPIINNDKKNNENNQPAITTTNRTEEHTQPIIKQQTDDEIIIEYFEEQKKQIDDGIKEQDHGKITKALIKFIDFLYYGEDIKGITRDDVKNETKEVLSETYEDILTLIDTVENSALYNKVKDETIKVLKETKDDAIELWDVTKNFFSKQKNKIKDWYETKTGKN